DRGLYGIYTQYKAGNVWTIGLNYYVAAKLLWDADLDVDALVEDYCRKMYGAASEPMLEYWQGWEQAAIDSDVHLAAEYVDLPKVFTPEAIAAQQERLNRARALAGDPDAAERVRRAEVVLGYVQVAMAYMDQVMQAAQQSARGRWVTLDAPAGDLGPYAEAVRKYIEDHAEDHCFGTAPSNYVDRFLSPSNAIGQVSAAIGGDKGPLDKRQWLAQTGTQPATGEPPEQFDIWLYANDIDGDDDKPEHRLLLWATDGQYQPVADLATPTARTANRADRCYVIGPLQAAQFIEGGKLRLQLVNLPGDWFSSTVFAWYVMPHIEGMADQQATGLVQGNLEWVRRAAAGFHEYDFNGERAGESVPVEETIEVFGFGAVGVP
ncbi:MAG TPA: DUF4838 domain-containing protein, partial [Armatimonadota bacterium]|nr:DUF4838 domain-containing protein [Armatimonadota bacterium]